MYVDFFDTAQHISLSMQVKQERRSQVKYSGTIPLLPFCFFLITFPHLFSFMFPFG